ncbi:MAG: GlsB/YeaQ/YmgE family stress response membrane protein [Oscillatoria sp. PMC 1051.18]|nr:GlsB/YeaQ/YmgE family stress response membrane protein [Oscillatoria sp. PMC 1050.18]MEC5028669.1 GlsB/YeaQ/YmgE family stress response membrane protein [Oscillatoria sp. PMC 1051.18]
MSIIAWIVLGLIAGALAKAIYPGHQGGGILSTIVLGIVGAVIGGSLATLLNTKTLAITSASLTIPGVILAIIGAIIAIFIWEKFARSRRI